MAMTMAITSLAATAIGGGISAYGSFQQGAAQQNMYNYQSRVAQINAQIADQQANAEQMAGNVRAQQAGLKGAETVGQTKAAIAAGGLDLGSGSAKSVISSEEEVTQQDQKLALWDSSQRQYALRVQGMQDTMQSNLDVAAGEGARTAADVQGYASILSDTASVSNKWVQYGPKGMGILS